MSIDYNFGIVLNPVGPLGGAQIRFTNLFRYLYSKYPGNAYYFVSFDLFNKIRELYKDYPLENVIPIGPRTNKKPHASSVNKNIGSISYKHNETSSLLRKTYRFLKGYKTQYFLFREIEKFRRTYNINVFLGVYSGIIPLYFYLKKKSRKVGIIFTDMDSWFSDIYADKEKYWYRKYSSFNLALEKSDYIDFLSPFILDGIRKRGLKIDNEKVSITRCSFTDYSKCNIGNKNQFQVAFTGRLERDKNPELFLDAAIQLSKKYSQIIFHIMGEGRLSGIIKKRIEEEGNARIIFHGYVPNPTEILAETSVFASLQRTNNYPSQSVLEAMACGNAIIATDVGDTRMFVNQNNGILINLNLDELINAIEFMYLNKDKTFEMGLFAEKYVKQAHTVQKAADYYTELFTRATIS